MKILKLSPGSVLEIKSITSNLSSYQAEVDGLIDIIEVRDDIDLVVNDEFLLNGSEPCLYINNYLLVHGDCFFKAYNSADLNEEQLTYLYKKLRRLKNGILVWIEN